MERNGTTLDVKLRRLQKHLQGSNGFHILVALSQAVNLRTFWMGGWEVLGVRLDAVDEEINFLIRESNSSPSSIP
jgi:hypothetical protein